MLARSPDGVRADEVATRLGKSVSTAYNVLASLCDEDVAVRRSGGIYQLAPGFRRAVAGESDPQDLSGIVEDLLARTHKRAYAATVRNGVLRVAIERGLQGMPKLPGMSPLIRDNAHALALGKVVLALSPPEAVERYVANGLRPFTPSTITTREELDIELREIRRTGIAVEKEEFDGDFCCIAAPVRDARGRVLAVLGISMTRRAFDEERETLARVLLDLAGTPARPPEPAPRTPSVPAASGRFQASAETRSVIDPAVAAHLASHHGTNRAVSAACARTSPTASATVRSERRYRP